MNQEDDSPLLELYFHFILIWIMVDLWVIFINNFAYNTIGMNEKSSYDNLIVALLATSCSLIIIGSGISILTPQGAPKLVPTPVHATDKMEKLNVNKQNNDDEQPLDIKKELIFNWDQYFVKSKKSKKKSRNNNIIDFRQFNLPRSKKNKFILDPLQPGSF